MKKLRNILLTVLIAIFMVGLLGTANKVNAESAGPIYLGIISLRSSGHGYMQSEKKVWKIAEYESLDDTTADTSKLIYCIKAGAGFGSENSSTDIKAYSQKFNLKNTSEITSPYVDVLPTGENYNKLIWLLDHIYTEIGSDDEDARNSYLSQVIPDQDGSTILVGDYTFLTDDDIDVIQQLAIWYFTNPTGDYHYTNIELYINSLSGTDANYKTLEDLFGDEGYDRQNAAKALYNYFITNADGTYTSTSPTTTPIEFIKTNATMQVIENNYVAGPYKINELLNIDYNITATYKNYGTEDVINPTIGIKDSSGNIVTTTKTLKELVGTEFYLIMPVSSGIQGIQMDIVSSYTNKTATYWSVENAPETEQPVVIIEDTTLKFPDSASIVVVEEKIFDLALRKFITQINGTDITDRIPNPDVTALANGTALTATYNHTKEPLKVDIGDTVTYTIRVYNEGEVDGYVTEITDHLPEQLEFIVDDALNIKYGWQLASSTDLRTVKTNYLSSENETTVGENKIVAFDGTTLAYKEVKIKCKVVSTDPMASKITNIADITGFTDGEGNSVVDRDSQAGNVTLPTGTDLENYKDPEIARGEEYIPGQQDDDDFEKLMMKAFDLALRKFITAVNDTEITSRIPTVDTTVLKAGTSTTATYNHSKEPVNVAIGDVVVYTIRVYNEGEIDGYVNEITDHLPDQLEYLSDNEINKKYGWQIDSTNSKIVKTDYLSIENETTAGENKIVAFDGEKLSYKDVQIVCKVVETNPIVKKITNIADITEFTDGAGNNVKDRDSEANNVEIPSDLPGYKDDEIGKNYVPGQQDDDDFEKVSLREFDLALRKFITAVNNTEVTTRYPVFSIDSEGNYVYTHTKEPVLVTNSNIVTYTIRVYNEGEMNGYASLIKDDIPEGLEFLPDNETNTEYRWIMLDDEGNETTDVSNAVTIATDYLSKEQEETDKDNLLLAFDKETMQEPDHKDVKVAFKVVESNKSDRIIINQAQIAEDTDEYGREVTDKDSTPDEWNDGEDDQDIEKIKVQYFDLALRKWVTQAIVIENGKTTVTETGHKAEDDPEGIVKVDLKKKNINSVTVKFRYSIRVTNEGQIAGYVKEIKDYIPEGLKFVAEDNPEWIQIEDNIITTDQAKDILLAPGESTEVQVVLTWINDGNNIGLKVNVAEISKDYNEFNAPDIDSTPDNKKDGEDDIDDAPVMLSVQTGQAQIYILLTGGVLIILVGGIALIKKYVL